MADNEYFKAKFESERFARISDFDSPAGRAAVAAFTKMTTSTVINDVYEAADSLQRHLASIDTPEARRDRLAALADRAGDNKSRSRAILSAIVDIPVEKTRGILRAAVVGEPHDAALAIITLGQTFSTAINSTDAAFHG